MIGKGRSKNLWQGVQTSNFFSPLHMFLMLRGQGVRCLASLHCFYKVSKYQMKGVHNHPFMTAFSVFKHLSVVDPGEAPLYVYTKLRPEGLKKKLGGDPLPPTPLPYPWVWMTGLDLPLPILLASIWGDPWTLSLDLPLTDYLAMNPPNSTQTSNVNLTETELVICSGFAVRVPVFLVRPRHKCLPSFCFQTHGQLPLHIEQAHVPQVYSRNHRDGSMIFMVFL